MASKRPLPFKGEAQNGSRVLALSTKRAQALQPTERPQEIRDSGVPGLILRIQPSGIKAWYLQLARSRRKHLGRFPAVTHEMARMAAHKLQGDQAIGEIVPTKRARVPTLGEFVNSHYRAYVKTHHRSARDTLGVLDTQFGHWFTRPLSALVERDLIDWRTQRLATGISKATVNRQVTVLKACVQQAVDRGILLAHPFAKVKPFRVDNGRVRFFAEDERARFLAALRAMKADSRRSHLYLAALLAYYTGLRLSEVNAINKANIDLENGLLTVPGAASKSGKTRHVPLHASLVNELREALEGLPETKTLNVGRPKRSWASLMAEARIDNFTFHCLRHDFASRLVMRGVDLRTVQALLGHHSPMMTTRYAHLAPDHVAGAIAKL